MKKRNLLLAVTVTIVAVMSSCARKEQGDKSETACNSVESDEVELGHACGLPHCPDQKCYMVDAEHRMKLPQTTSFCDKCRSKLLDKGVKL